jgi:hypothetical protein
MNASTASPVPAASPGPATSRRLQRFDLIPILAIAAMNLLYGVLGAAAGAVIYLLAMVMTGEAIDPATIGTDKSLLQLAIIAAAIYAAAAILLGAWGIAQWRGLDWRRFGLGRPRHWWWFAIALAGLAALIGYDYLAVHLFDPDGAIQAKIRRALLIRSDSLA